MARLGHIYPTSSADWEPHLLAQTLVECGCGDEAAQETVAGVAVPSVKDRAGRFCWSHEHLPVLTEAGASVRVRRWSRRCRYFAHQRHHDGRDNKAEHDD